MKKKTAVFILLFTAFAANAFADHDARYDELKKYKEEQREARKNAPASTAPHEKTFWEKEGDRSGLGNSGNGVGNFVKNLNPVPFFKSQQDAYNARKTGGVK